MSLTQRLKGATVEEKLKKHMISRHRSSSADESPKQIIERVSKRLEREIKQIFLKKKARR